jgi:UDP-N-acetylglucosamine 2-epimerase
MRSALEFADVQTFAARGGDLDGLLRWLRPDALIVDGDDAAVQATAYARENSLPVLHVSVREHALRLLRDGTWESVGDGTSPEPETIRNVVAGALFRREGAAG